MKDILMMVHTMGTLETTDNDRYTYLAKMLMAENASVEIVTSDYEHHKKRYRDKNIAKQHPFKITFIHENRYRKNVSVQRIIGHISFAIRLNKYLKNREKPDVIYCAIPPTISANIIAKYAEKNNIKFVIDVQDLWPESFYIALGKNVFTKALLKPIAVFVNGAYKRADTVVAVSDTYVNRVMRNNHKAKEKFSVYLGTDGVMIDKIEMHENRVEKKVDEFWIGYIGNLGISYDFENLMKALYILKTEGITNIKMLFVGDGVKRKDIEDLGTRYFPNIEITGYLPYSEMFKYLKKCDLTVNPIIKGAANSVVNKVGDYAAAGIAVVNTQDNQEYRNLIDNYEAGLNTIPGNPKGIADKIKELYVNSELRRKMGENNRRLFEDRFDRSKTYKKIVGCLME